VEVFPLFAKITDEKSKKSPKKIEKTFLFAVSEKPAP
jgi:hypothetical protein